MKLSHGNTQPINSHESNFLQASKQAHQHQHLWALATVRSKHTANTHSHHIANKTITQLLHRNTHTAQPIYSHRSISLQASKLKATNKASTQSKLAAITPPSHRRHTENTRAQDAASKLMAPGIVGESGCAMGLRLVGDSGCGMALRLVGESGCEENQPPALSSPAI